jgi:hypothetical protein
MYVRTQLEALRARGEDTANIEKGVFVDLFDAYACASDKAFVTISRTLRMDMIPGATPKLLQPKLLSRP